MTQMDELRDSVREFPNLDAKKISRVVSLSKEAVSLVMGDSPHEGYYLDQCSEEPLREEYTSGFSIRALMQPTDYLIPFIWFFVFAMSLLHMLTLAGTLASNTYLERPEGFLGIWADKGSYTYVHQIAFFCFSELGIIFFYTRWRLGYYSSKWFMAANINLWFSIFCTIVVLWANISALMKGEEALLGIFIGVLISAITVGLGERISELIREVIEFRLKKTLLYEEAYNEWSTCRQDARQDWRTDLEQWHFYMEKPTEHPEYQKFLSREIISYYQRTQLGKSFSDWNPYVERVLAAREIARMGEVGDMESMISFFTQSEPSISTEDGQESIELLNYDPKLPHVDSLIPSELPIQDYLIERTKDLNQRVPSQETKPMP